MTRRSEIFSTENVANLISSSRFLRLFQKDTWEDYLELIAQIYDLLEERGVRVEHSEISQMIERFYLTRDIRALDQKNVQVLSMFISELGLLRDSHDATGNRFIEATRDGKQLLRLCERLIQNRPNYTGAGAEALVGALNHILNDPKEITPEEALKLHQETIQRYRDDMKRIQESGVHASELLSAGLSLEELFQTADEEASHIVAASEDVKLAIESARKDLMKNYHDRSFSAGKAIEFITDFHDALRKKPEHQSYARAKDILSHIEGLGSLHRHRDVAELYQLILNKSIIPRHVLHQSSISQFSRHFQNSVRGIEEKTQEQIQLLRVQVHYVVTGDSKRTREDLTELQGTLFSAGPQGMAFLANVDFRVPDGLEIEMGPLLAHELEIETPIELPAMELNSFDSGDKNAIAEFLKQAEEATVEQVLKKLQAAIDRQGSVLLSEYPITFGITEYYVLAGVSYFSEAIRSEVVGSTDLLWEDGARAVCLPGVTNHRYSFA